MSYEKKILGIVEYYRYMYRHWGLRKMISLTDSRYPHFLTLGWCSDSCEEVVVCRIGNWRLRLMHEIGHEIGMQHVMKKGFLMHPWGIFRGKRLL